MTICLCFFWGGSKKSWATFAGSLNHDWLVVSTPLKNMSQNGNLPQGSGWKWKISLKPPPSWATFYRISWSILGCSASRVFSPSFFFSSVTQTGAEGKARFRWLSSLTSWRNNQSEWRKGKVIQKVGTKKKTVITVFEPFQFFMV